MRRKDKPNKPAAQNRKAQKRAHRSALRREKEALKKEKATLKKEKASAREKEKEKIAQAKRESLELKNKRRAAARAERAKVYKQIRKKLRNSPYGFGHDNYGFYPRVELETSGDAASVVSAFAAASVDIRDLQKDGAILRFKIRKKDMSKGIAILNSMCYNFKVGKQFGFFRTLFFLGARCGLMLGAVAAVALLNISYSYVWRIEVSGNDKLSKAAVIAAMRDAGFVTGLKKTAVDCSEVSAAVNTLDGVSDAGAELIGTTLYVYVLEADDFSVRTGYKAYESAYDATVTRIVLRSGSAKVARGDVVKAGDILADGSAYSTTGELLYFGECDADIYGDISVTVTAEIGAQAVEYRRTGRSKVKTGISVFGHRFFDTASPYASYESVVTTANYDVLLPIYVTSYRYYETQPITVERDIDAVASEFAAAEAEARKFTGDFKSSYSVKPTVSGLYRVNIFLSGEALISRGTDNYSEQVPD